MNPIEKLVALVYTRTDCLAKSKPVISGDGTTINTQRSLVFYADETLPDEPPQIKVCITFHWVDNDKQFGVAVEATFNRSCTVHHKTLYETLQKRWNAVNQCGLDGIECIAHCIVL